MHAMAWLNLYILACRTLAATPAMPPMPPLTMP